MALEEKNLALASPGMLQLSKREANKLVIERKMPHLFKPGFNSGFLIVPSCSLTPSQPAFDCPVRGLTGWPHRQDTKKANYGHTGSKTQHRGSRVIWLRPQMLDRDPEVPPWKHLG